MTISIKQIAEALEEIAMLLDLKGENTFKIRAYENASRIIRAWDGSVDELAEQANAGQIKGIGKALSEKIDTLVTDGSLPYLDELRAEFPAGLFEILRIPGLGAKKVKVLYEQLHITTLGELEYACLENRLIDLKGFGKKTQDNILAGIKRVSQYSGRFRYPVGEAAAKTILSALRKSNLAQQLEIGGSMRRRKETIKDVDILATSTKPEKLMDVFVKHPEVNEVVAHGPTKSSVVLGNGIAIDLRVVTDEQFAPALMYFTGSKDHNTILRGLAKKKGYKLNEYGLFKGEKPFKAKSEDDIYKKLGLTTIPPELREGLGEVEYAMENEFPHLVEVDDIKGIMHAHTNFSDGANTVEQLARACRNQGFQYLAISDHSQTAAYAGGLKPDDIKRQHEQIDCLNEALAPFRIFKGIESDILADGSLDYDDKVLASFDFVIASVHSLFKMDEKTMTARIVRAVQNPFTTVLGHPTGRLLLSRDGYPLNLSAVLEAAAEAGTAIEINAHPYRLDLDWRYCRKAKELGIPIPINPDAHEIEGFDHIRYGVGVARKGWLTADDVMTAWDVDRIADYFARRKP